MIFHLPMPPSDNRVTRFGQGNVYSAAPAKDYAALVRAKVALVYKAKPWTGPVVVDARFFFKSLSSDCTNRLGVLLDALQGVFYLNDRQVFRATETKYFRASGKPEEVVLHIEEANLNVLGVPDLAARLKKAEGAAMKRAARPQKPKPAPARPLFGPPITETIEQRLRRMAKPAVIR